LEQPRILIVDDEPFNLDLLEQELELLGYGSVRAVDGRNALERLQSEAFDLVLLDVMMPGIDGFGVLERMKSHREVAAHSRDHDLGNDRHGQRRALHYERC
jgi:adenylate cyclase